MSDQLPNKPPPPPWADGTVDAVPPRRLGPRHPPHVSAQDLEAKERAAGTGGGDVPATNDQNTVEERAAGDGVAGTAFTLPVRPRAAPLYGASAGPIGTRGVATARRDNDPPHVLITQYQVVQPPTPARTVEEAPRQLPSSTAAAVPAPEAGWSLANPVPLGPRHPRHVSAQDLTARERAAANDGVDIAAVPVPAPTVQEAGWSLATAVPLGPRHPRHVSAQDLAARESAWPSVGAGVAEPNNLPTRPDAEYSLARTPASLAMLGPRHGTHVSAYDLAIRERAADVPAPTVGEGGFSLARTPASLGPRHGTHVSAYAQDLAVRERTLATAARTGGSGTGASIGSGPAPNVNPRPNPPHIPITHYPYTAPLPSPLPPSTYTPPGHHHTNPNTSFDRPPLPLSTNPNRSFDRPPSPLPSTLIPGYDSYRPPHPLESTYSYRHRDGTFRPATPEQPHGYAGAASGGGAQAGMGRAGPALMAGGQGLGHYGQAHGPYGVQYGIGYPFGAGQPFYYPPRDAGTSSSNTGGQPAPVPESNQPRQPVPAPPADPNRKRQGFANKIAQKYAGGPAGGKEQRGVDPGSFEDDDEFFRQQDESEEDKSEDEEDGGIELDPNATIFEPGCKPGGAWDPNRRKDDPSGDGGGGLGAPEQVVWGF